MVHAVCSLCGAAGRVLYDSANWGQRLGRIRRRRSELSDLGRLFLGPAQTPLGTEPMSMMPMPPHPSQKVIKTEFTTIVLSDDPAVGGFYINATDEAVPVPVTIVGNALGLRLDATLIDGEPMTRMTMVTEEGITLFYTEGTIAMTAAAIETNIGATTMIYTDGSTTLQAPRSAQRQKRLSRLVPARICH